jgi:hypothetical protein
MARFYGTLNAGRSTATKCGHPADGISATARGWDIGGEVSMRAKGDTDTVHLEVTPGSNGAGHRLHVGTFELVDRGVYRCTGGALLALIDAAAAALELVTDPDANADDPDIEKRANRVTVDLARALLGIGHGVPQAVRHE